MASQAAVGGPPPPDHPIYGTQGIMHGIVLGRRVDGLIKYSLDDRVQRRSPNVHGHNGIAVGSWFANQLVALQRGAHGSRMGGIGGTIAEGAFSIVVSSGYGKLNDDRGDIIYYSTPRGADNTNKYRPAKPTRSTRLLMTSLENGHPVRVLRSSGFRGNPLLPSCGLRYDGLYRVIRVRDVANRHGEYTSSCKTPLQHPTLSI